MTTYVRAAEAARRLGVTPATLYSYVSRGRVTRKLAVDGRSSLFDVDELDRLVADARRPPPPRPTIDVRIASAVTQLDESGLRYRGVPVEDLVTTSYEEVCALLWRVPSVKLSAPSGPANAIERADTLGLVQLASTLAEATPPGDAPLAAANLLGAIPGVLGGSSGARRGYASRVTSIWMRRPSDELVRAVDTALILLADHELATSTLAVRVAASVRASPYAALIAGLATVEGSLHGSAAAEVHAVFEAVAASDAATVIARYREQGLRLPGFGHKIYRERDPRLAPLMTAVAELPDPHRRLDIVRSLVTTAAPSITRQPNIDLGLAALLYVSGLPADAPLFAIARIAGWTAHYLEELDERPLRFRGLAR